MHPVVGDHWELGPLHPCHRGHYNTHLGATERDVCQIIAFIFALFKHTSKYAEVNRAALRGAQPNLACAVGEQASGRPSVRSAEHLSRFARTACGNDGF